MHMSLCTTECVEVHSTSEYDLLSASCCPVEEWLCMCTDWTKLSCVVALNLWMPWLWGLQGNGRVRDRFPQILATRMVICSILWHSIKLDIRQHWYHWANQENYSYLDGMVQSFPYSGIQTLVTSKTKFRQAKSRGLITRALKVCPFLAFGCSGCSQLVSKVKCLTCLCPIKKTSSFN